MVEIAEAETQQDGGGSSNIETGREMHFRGGWSGGQLGSYPQNIEGLGLTDKNKKKIPMTRECAV